MLFGILYGRAPVLVFAKNDYRVSLFLDVCVRELRREVKSVGPFDSCIFVGSPLKQA